MKLKKTHLAIIAVSVLILAGCIGLTAFLLFSNYQNVRLFKQARANFLRGDAESVALAESQLLQVIRTDSDNEEAYSILGKIAGSKQIYPEQVYYNYMAYRLNPLSDDNKNAYIRSLGFARYFDRLENFLAKENSLNEEQEQLLLYAAARNGSSSKYKKLQQRKFGIPSLGALALLRTAPRSAAQKVEILKKYPTATDTLVEQEYLAVLAESYLALRDISSTEKKLLQAYKLNKFAFAPVLGRFYANFRSFGKALAVFEDYLEIYHDPAVAMQTAEIYCLLKQTALIAALRNRYQSDSGNSGMLLCYYLDALNALAKNDISALKELCEPLRDTIKTPLASFMFLCVDLQEGDPAAINNSYASLLQHRSYLDLQKRADSMVSLRLKQLLADGKHDFAALLPLANQLYKRQPEAFTAKIILLAQKNSGSINISMLKDALKHYSTDRGIVRIAIEYYLEHDLAECERLIGFYRNNFAERRISALPYEIMLAAKKKDLDKVSALFQQNFSPELSAEYWNFASTSMRENDLRFLSKDQLYKPFCEALLRIKNGDKDSACAILENADSKSNLQLLFFAAKTLAENGRNQAALKKYAQFPPDSPYRIAVLLNTAELHAENRDFHRALNLAKEAYDAAPDLPETQLCYADKLHKTGNSSAIPDVIKLSASAPYRKKLEELYIAGMEARIKATDINKSPEKLRILCETVLHLDAFNKTAIDNLQKVREVQFRKLPLEQQKTIWRE